LSSTEYIGIIAGFLTTFSTLPQIIRIYKLKSAREISYLFNTLLLLGIVTWMIYGIVLGLASIIIWNAMGIVLISWLLFFKIRYGRVKNG
jgi:MtN3 and saliva related transmembrane protein